jgi:hypothetical protein
MQPLHPFEPRQELDSIQLEGEAVWRDGRLQGRFALRCRAESLRWPAMALPPARCDGLWQSTCLEAFIAAKGHTAYWEVNLAPSGDWNVYALSDYRENLRPVAEITSLPYVLRRTENELQLEFQLDLSRWIPPTQPLEISLTAVLDDPGHGLSYWAWRHCGEQPDFHRRDSFQQLDPKAGMNLQVPDPLRR